MLRLLKIWKIFNFSNCKYLPGGGSIGKCLGFSAKWSLTGKLQIFRAICATEENRRIASNIRIRPKAVFAFSQPREQIANLRFFNSNASNFHPSTSRCTLEKQTLKIEDNSDGYIWALDSNSYQYTRFRGHVEKDLPTFKRFRDFICFCIRRLPYHWLAKVHEQRR